MSDALGGGGLLVVAPFPPPIFIMLSLLVSSRDNRRPPPPFGLEFSFTTIPTPVARGWRCRKPNDGGGVYDSETAIVVVVLLSRVVGEDIWSCVGDAIFL